VPRATQLCPQPVPRVAGLIRSLFWGFRPNPCAPGQQAQSCGSILDIFQWPRATLGYVSSSHGPLSLHLPVGRHWMHLVRVSRPQVLLVKSDLVEDSGMSAAD